MNTPGTPILSNKHLIVPAPAASAHYGGDNGVEATWTTEQPEAYGIPAREDGWNF